MDLSTKHLRDLFGGNIPTAPVLQGIAAGLADCGVTVVVDPRVTIPQAIPSQRKILLPAHVRSERALLIVSWYLDHETGHIIFTPPPEDIVENWEQDSRMLDVCKAKGYTGIPEELIKTAHFFLNCVEDARVENLMVRRFPGCKKHFIGGPIALDVQDPFTPTLEKAKELQQQNNLPNPPLNPFFVGELHANSLLNGKHGQMDKDYIRQIAPPHVGWVLDVVDDNFGDIRDVCSVSCEELAARVDKVMALILEKKLPDMSEAEEEEGDQEGEQGGDDRFAEEFDKPKKKKGKGQKGKGQKGDSDDGEEQDQDSEDGSGDDDSEGSMDEEADESEEGESGSESGERGTGGADGGDEEGDSDSDEDDSEDDESEGGRGDGDDEAEDDSADGSDGEADAMEADDGGDAEDDDSGEDQASDSGDEERGGEGDEEAEADEGEEGEEGEEPAGGDTDPVTGDIQKQADFNQIIEWAKDAQTDMAQLMREAQEAEEAAKQNAPGGDQDSASAGSPNVAHAGDIAGMPDEYLRRMAPGVGVVVIANQDLDALVNMEDPTFREYDRFIQEIMPKDLGPAARRLMGKFKSAPGKAWQGNRINPKMLQPIVSGHAHGRPLYLRRQETVQSRKGVCVMLCLDCSGSMISGVYGLNLPSSHNSKFSVSHAAGRGIARLLQRIQVPFAVMGYTTDSTHRGGNYSSSRWVDIVNFLFKDFHEPWTVAEQKMLAMNANTRTTYKDRYIYPETNSDGESLLWAATQIITRPEDRKIMIVLSDGLPAAGDNDMQSKFLKWAVRRIELAGIHIGALGIGDRGVVNYYRVYELLDKFPVGWGDKNTAPFLIQEKLITLIDRLATDQTQ